MAGHDQAVAQGGKSPGAFRLLLAIPALLLVVLLAGLGTWQVHRLQWKLDLIERVQARVHAAPVAPPPPARWPRISAESDEYRRVKLAGTYLYEFTTPVLALTERGGGYWLLTPMCTQEGRLVLVNRGFIPSEPGARTRYAGGRAAGDPCARARGKPVEITGLLRVSERGGLFSRANDVPNNRWYSRDVAAIAAARGLADAAPFFVDAGANQNPPDSPDRPEGGLTVVDFHNSHLVYAVTWYALALMVLGAWRWVARGAKRGSDERTDDAHA